MTYRVGLLEDEEIIRRGIKLKFPFSEHGFEIVIEEADGHAVLSLLERAQTSPVDIFLVDIMMPKLNGLDFIAKAKAIWPSIHFVIISGYNEFDYARKALQLGVKDYLLKPIKPLELEKIMLETRNRLDQIKVEEQENLKDEVSLWLVQEGTYSLSPMGRNWLRSECEKDVYLYIILFGNFSSSIMNENQIKFPNFPDYYLAHRNIWVHITGDSDYMSRLFEHFPNETITIARFSGLKDYNQIPELVNSGIKIIRNSLILGVQSFVKVIVKDGEIQHHVHLDNPIMDDMETLLIKEESELEAFQLLKEIVNKPVLQRFKESAFQRFAAKHLHKELSLEWLQSFDQPDEFSKECIQFIESHLNFSGSLRGQDILFKVVESLEQEYRFKITLKDYAKKYYIHPNHLARLFKKEYDMTFLDYLTKIRMEKAKELLEQLSIKNYEIAKMVGFDDGRYFSQAFKRYTGITPKEYRGRLQLS